MIPIRDDNPTRRRAVVTLLLVVVNVGIYFGIQFPKHDANAEALFEYRWAGIPCEIHTGKPIVVAPPSVVSTVSPCAIPATGIVAPERPFPHKNVWLARRVLDVPARVDRARPREHALLVDLR